MAFGGGDSAPVPGPVLAHLAQSRGQASHRLAARERLRGLVLDVEPERLGELLIHVRQSKRHLPLGARPEAYTELSRAALKMVHRQPLRRGELHRLPRQVVLQLLEAPPLGLGQCRHDAPELKRVEDHIVQLARVNVAVIHQALHLLVGDVHPRRADRHGRRSVPDDLAQLLDLFCRQ
ncbi:MAG: hypothetical protein KJN79_00630 [Gammaproteobacteria bacterium]|nr:hypothetical protein [Gammaproteobacteria bacterium]